MRRPEDNAFSGEESLAPINLTVPSSEVKEHTGLVSWFLEILGFEI